LTGNHGSLHCVLYVIEWHSASQHTKLAAAALTKSVPGYDALLQTARARRAVSDTATSASMLAAVLPGGTEDAATVSPSMEPVVGGSKRGTQDDAQDATDKDERETMATPVFSNDNEIGDEDSGDFESESSESESSDDDDSHSSVNSDSEETAVGHVAAFPVAPVLHFDKSVCLACCLTDFRHKLALVEALPSGACQRVRALYMIALLLTKTNRISWLVALGCPRVCWRVHHSALLAG
jgi:hypothetical protein